jgi:hypothetical protein
MRALAVIAGLIWGTWAAVSCHEDRLNKRAEVTPIYRTHSA